MDLHVVMSRDCSSAQLFQKELYRDFQLVVSLFSPWISCFVLPLSLSPLSAGQHCGAFGGSLRRWNQKANKRSNIGNLLRISISLLNETLVSFLLARKSQGKETRKQIDDDNLNKTQKYIHSSSFLTLHQHLLLACHAKQEALTADTQYGLCCFKLIVCLPLNQERFFLLLHVRAVYTCSYMDVYSSLLLHLLHL